MNKKKKDLHKHFQTLIENLKLEHDIFLAEIDLENDIVNALLDEGISNCSLNGEVVDLEELKSELQYKKWHNMFLFLEENEELFEIIFKNSRFDFLKEVKACLV